MGPVLRAPNFSPLILIKAVADYKNINILFENKYISVYK